MTDLAEQPAYMVESQIARRGVKSPQVLDAMRRVPRERFVPEKLAEFAYEDSPLPIGFGQTISQPYVVALMIDAAEIAPGDRVLEIGTGSAYAAAVISLIATRVYTIEYHAGLATSARDRLASLGYGNVEVRAGDGGKGWPEAAPFDAIIVAAGGPDVPDSLRRQLKPGGRLVLPVGSQDAQRLLKLTRTGEDEYQEEDLGSVLFVPLLGDHGASPGTSP